MAYKYLNEPIILYFTLPSEYTGKNVPYSVVNTTTGKTIYTGAIYATGKKQKLILNDIVNLTTDTFDWFRNDSNVYKETLFIANSPLFSDIKITFNGSINYTIKNIVHGYTYPNATGSPSTPLDNMVGTVNAWSGILPRIPKLTDPIALTPQNDFFAMFTLTYNNTTGSHLNAMMQFKLYDVNGNRISFVDSPEIIPTAGYIKYVIGSLSMYSRFVNAADKELGYFTASVSGRDGYDSNETIIAYVDNNPADYYVMWINRFGTWQCQPLCSKWELTEKVTTNSITSVYNETIPHSKITEFNWKLNTHWLTYAEHEEFQSLLTSKYVYLYNTKTHEGHYVTVTDSNWTFKNEVNTSKPFNLTLNLTKSVKQNITL